MNRNCQMQTARSCNSGMMQRSSMQGVPCDQNNRMQRQMHHHCNKSEHENMNQQQLLCHISEVSFAVDDILLYLDTHPHDQEALKYAHEMVSMRNNAMAVYARRFGPLTIDTINERDCDCWEWAMQPWPWETPMRQRGGCR